MQNVKEQSVKVEHACTENLAEQARTSAFDRLVVEKQELDERIIKLSGVLIDEKKAFQLANYVQIELMQRQLDVMLEYSSILNTRILRWKK